MLDIRLSELRVGERAKVLGFASGDRSHRQKLLAMGLTPGTDFTFSRRAPLGDPIEIQVRGFALILRKEEAHYVKVERVPL